MRKTSYLMKTLLINVMATFLLLSTLDLIAYLFLPHSIATIFPDYQQTERPDVLGRGAYPKDYFVQNKQRGFDIGENRRAFHWVEGIKYKIWSNSLGCFDNEHSNYDDYVYFAGDSFTWGYTPFDQKFGTIVEKRSGGTVLKCGVTHTGQLHQYEKLVEVAAKVGAIPRAVVVFYTPNDVANDHFHPHSTVIDGWLVDNVVIDRNDRPVRRSDAELKKDLDDHLRDQQEQRERNRSVAARIKSTALRYSLSLNIVDAGYRRVKSSLTARVGPLVTSDASLPPTRSFYLIPHEFNGRFWYTNNPSAVENKAAILLLRDFAVRNNVALVFVLIPEKAAAINEAWYEELRLFLSANKLRYIDLTTYFREGDAKPSDLYWRRNPHFNPKGNEVVAEVLLREIPELLSNRHVVD